MVDVSATVAASGLNAPASWFAAFEEMLDFATHQNFASQTPGLSLADVIPWNTAHSTWVKLLENVPSNVSFLTQCSIFNFSSPKVDKCFWSSELLPKIHDWCMIILSESSKPKTNHKKQWPFWSKISPKIGNPWKWCNLWRNLNFQNFRAPWIS